MGHGPGAHNGFRVELRREGRAAILVIAGELDGGSAPELDTELEAVWQSDAATVILDLREVEFIDSIGLRSVVLAHRRAETEGRAFALVEGTEQVRELLRWSGLLPRVRVVSAPEELLR